MAEYYNWLSAEEMSNVHRDSEKIELEIADIMSYLIMLCDKTDIDLVKALEDKIERNRAKL